MNNKIQAFDTRNTGNAADDGISITATDLPNDKRGLDTTATLIYNGQPVGPQNPLPTFPASDPDMLPPQSNDSGNIAPQGVAQKIYGPVPVGKTWQVMKIDLWSSGHYKTTLTATGQGPIVFGNTALVPVNQPLPNLELTAGQFLTLDYKNQNPSLGGAAVSTYSTLWIAERSA